MPRNLPTKPEELEQETKAKTDAQKEGEGQVESDFVGMTAPSYSTARKKAIHVPVMKYRVEAGPEQGKWAVVMNGGKTFLAGGKVIDSRQYDIRKLVLQGVKLTELGEE